MSELINNQEVRIKTLKEVMDGSWKGGIRTIWGKPEGANDVVKFAAVIPEPIKKKAQEALDGIKAGTMSPFTGPVFDSTGKERLAKGVVADQDWKDKVDFYVRGVDGKIPTGK